MGEGVVAISFSFPGCLFSFLFPAPQKQRLGWKSITFDRIVNESISYPYPNWNSHFFPLARLRLGEHIYWTSVIRSSSYQNTIYSVQAVKPGQATHKSLILIPSPGSQWPQQAYHCLIAMTAQTCIPISTNLMLQSMATHMRFWMGRALTPYERCQ